MWAWLLLAVLFLAYANGANDNFKGVATLFGSRTADYRTALGWATATTFAGSLAALGVSKGLVKASNGNGLVPAVVTIEPAFLLAVGLGAAATVTLATVTSFLVLFASRLGLPVSTTHVSCGSLFGLGAITGQGRVQVIRNVILSWMVTLPVAAGLAAALYRLGWPRPSGIMAPRSRGRCAFGAGAIRGSAPVMGHLRRMA